MSILRQALGITLSGLLGAGACFPAELRDRHASAVEEYLPTPFVDPEAPFMDPSRALGPPDGRTLALGDGAYVVLRFFRPIPDAPGPDLRVYEVGPDGAQARLAASLDGVTFVELPRPIGGPTESVDLADLGLAEAAYLRIRGIDDAGEDPGYDLDAVEALH
ncbi:MAG: hypothetical protein H6730_28475 [Deltaproteobacteria bacterium]|nr:hypothetical protein [Deltaproteobacteria bacterium]